MQPLSGARQTYDWGSTTSMFEFLGKVPDGEPFAELWLGAHNLAPAMVDTPSGPMGLDEAIAQNQAAYLGEKVSNGFGRLPYLVKLLAPARPLSLQVHPIPSLALDGFRRENRLNIPLSDHRRSFKDEHHKPEMVYAITPFEGLAGFRPSTEVDLVLAAIGGPVSGAHKVTVAGEHFGSLQPALEHFLRLNEQEIDQVTQKCRILENVHSDPVVKAACKTVSELADIYPTDVGVVVSLLLNRVLLQPGQTLFIADGVPHAYLSGFGLEVMANSDNVLRLGLTSKHIDIPSMLEALDFTSSGYSLEAAPQDAATYTFTPPTKEFALSISKPHLSAGKKIKLPGDGPRILVCLNGVAIVTSHGDERESRLTQGGSLFIGANEGDVSVSGEGALAEVFVP